MTASSRPTLGMRAIHTSISGLWATFRPCLRGLSVTSPQRQGREIRASSASLLCAVVYQRLRGGLSARCSLGLRAQSCMRGERGGDLGLANRLLFHRGQTVQYGGGYICILLLRITLHYLLASSLCGARAAPLSQLEVDPALDDGRRS